MIGVLLVSMLATTGCSDLLFRNDHRITITSPGSYATVGVPLTVTWTVRDFNAPNDGSFAVFLDRDPQPPGQTLDQFGGRPFDIFRVSQPSLRLDTVVPHHAADALERNQHDITVILLDRSGRRIGESQAFVEFNVRGT
jgi:hypothetical protein